MAETDPVWQRAEADLIITDACGARDCLLWEHSVRVARAAERMTSLPQLADTNVDHLALLAAALYHEAGWVARFKAGQVGRWEIMKSPTGGELRVEGANFLRECGQRLLPGRSLETACEAIRQCNSKTTDVVEAQLLAEADNLDEVGPLALWQMVRRHLAEGKGVGAVIDAWHRQQEYGFWQARIKEGFRFEPIRRLAERRLAAMEKFLSAVRLQQSGEDLADLLQALPRRVPDKP